MKTKQTAFMTLAVLAALSLSASGAIIYSEDFEGATADVDTLNSLGWTGNGSIVAFIRDDTTATPFGADNQFAVLANDGAAFRYNDLDISSAGAAYIRLSFDILYPAAYNATAYMRQNVKGDVSGTSNANANWLDMGNGNRDIQLDTDIVRATACHFDVIYNISGSTQNWNGSDIADEQFDVWIDGSLAKNDKAMDRDDAAVATQFDKIGFWPNQGSDFSTADIYIDNIVVEAIPEPATIGLMGIAAAALAAVRKLRMS